MNTIHGKVNGKGNIDKTLLGLLSICILVLLVANPAGNFPVNDDYIYTNAVRSVVETGTFKIRSSNAFDFIPIQLGIFFCSLTGFSYLTLRIITIAFHLLGISAVYGGMQELGLSKRDSALFASVYAFNPMLTNLALTFMTDIPAIALSNCALFFAFKGLKSRSSSPFFIASLFLLAAFSVRQTSIVFIPAIAIAGLLSIRDKVHRYLFAISLATPAVVNGPLQSWLASGTEHLSYLGVFSNHLASKGMKLLSNPGESFTALEYTISYLGLLGIPIVAGLLVSLRKVMTFPRRSLAFGIVSAIACLIPLTILAQHASMPYSRNLLGFPFVGTYCLIGGTPTWSMQNLKSLTNFTTFSASLTIFFIALTGTLALTRDFKDSRAHYIFCASVLIISICALVILIQTGNFDRYYLLALSPLLFVLAQSWKMISPEKPAVILASLLSLAMAAYSAVTALDMMNFHRAQYRAIEFLEDENGILPARIDGGPAYNLGTSGMRLSQQFVHSDEFAGWPESLRGGPQRSNYRWWPVSQEDYIISSIRLPYFHEAAKFKYFSPVRCKTTSLMILESDNLDTLKQHD